jgi:hypothetical protein
METGTTVLDIQKKYSSRALMLAIGAGLLFLPRAKKKFAGDWCWEGCSVRSTLRLWASCCATGSATTARRPPGDRFVSLLLRYALLAIPLVLAVQSERFNLPATVVGIFMVQLVIMIEHGSRLIFTSVKL